MDRHAREKVAGELIKLAKDLVAFDELYKGNHKFVHVFNKGTKLDDMNIIFAKGNRFFPRLLSAFEWRVHDYLPQEYKWGVVAKLKGTPKLEERRGRNVVIADIVVSIRTSGKNQEQAVWLKRNNPKKIIDNAIKNWKWK
jgi:hypothetical protein